MSQYLNIAFILRFDPRDKRTLSGIPYFMLKSLKERYQNVDVIAPFKYYTFFRLTFGILNKYIFPIFTKRRIDYSHSILMSKACAYYFGKKLKSKNYDIIIAPMASAELAYLNTEVPILYVSDATFELIESYYARYSNLFEFSKREANEIERKALHNCTFSILSSNWAIKSAQSFYGISKEKTKFIPFGANIDSYPKRSVLTSKFKSHDCCQLLFLGVDWERKGGDIAFKTFIELKERGIKTKFIICGCNPSLDYKNDDLLIIPFLNKNKEEDSRTFQKILEESNFLILPTRAECTPISFCEANSYGLPVITTDTGGVTSVISDGINGHALNIDDGELEYADIIESLWKNREHYNNLVKSSRAEFENRLNWEKWGESVTELIDQLMVERNKNLIAS